jgi:two-component system phosphate regulon sensor histidine kinase PhoR
MFRNFRWKLTGSYLILILLLVTIGGSMVFSSFKNYYLQNLEQRLTREAYLIADMVKYIEPDKTNAYQDICDKVSRDNGTRVSIIDQNGVVLGDSEADTSMLDIHKSRPEVYQALHGKVGVAMRYSKTLKINMLYVAVPFTDQVQSGVVRVAMTLSELTAINQRILMLMLFALLVSAGLAVLLSLLMAKRFSDPLNEITTVVQEMSEGNLKRRIIANQGIDELRLLAGAYNDMADNIEQGVSDLNEVKNRLEVVLNNTVNGILMIDAEGKISYANPAALVLLGMQTDIIGHNKTEVIKNYAILETIDQVKSELRPVRDELMLHLSGKNVEINIVPILNAARTNQGVLVVLNDISELKRLEQVRKDFVANVSHELKTPVAAISGFAETLLDEGGDNPETVMEFSRIIYEEAQRLTSLINGLLELSRLESEKAAVNILPVDIDKVLRSALTLAQRQPNSQQVTLEYIPAASQPVIASDTEFITQVVSNLLDNAIKYSPAGGKIQLQLEAFEDMVKINVIDTGLGIPEKEIPRIFERFYRVDKARSRKTGGSGLGLAIVKHLVEQLGGQVSVESKLGEGSVFSVILPKNENLIIGKQ